MPRELVPELHDVLKLTDLKQDCQDFSRWGCEPPTRTWDGVRRHQNFSQEWKPSDRETFVLHIADGVAASISRHLNPHRLRESPDDIHSPARNQFARTMSGETRPGVQKLWQDVEEKMSPLLGDEQVTDLLHFLATDPTYDEFKGVHPKGLPPTYQTYADLLRAHPEDKRVLSRITTLETHLMLVGKLYRQLLPVLPVRDNLLGLTQQQLREAVRKVEEEFGLWVFRIKLRFNQQPFRTRDLTVLLRLQTVVEDVVKNFPDGVILAQLSEVVIISPDAGLLDQVQEITSRAGFWLEVIRCQQKLAELRASTVVSVAAQPVPSADGECFGATELLHLYADVPSKITPPICEVCQSAAAEHQWPRESRRAAEEEKQGPQDDLCMRCFEFREAEMGSVRLGRLARWTDLPSAHVLWTRIALDYDCLISALKELYFRYMESCRDLVLSARKKAPPEVQQEWAEVRFPLIAEFQADYQRFLESLNRRFHDLFDESRTQFVLPGFYCFLAQNNCEALSLARGFLEAAQIYFPGFLKTSACPLRLSVALCSVKHPFFEVWRQWQEQQSEVEVHLVGHGRLRLRARDLERFLQLAEFPFRRSALHNLAEIARISQQLAELHFRSRAEKAERNTFEQLDKFLPLGLDFQGILTLAKLMQA